MTQRLNSSKTIVVFVITLLLGVGTKAIAQSAKLPQPDFSEMEKWYDVLSWSVEKYGTIKIDIRVKTNPPHNERIFTMKYYDKNGAELGSYQIMGVGYGTPKGTVEHVEANGTSEDKMAAVKAIVIYRRNEDGTYTGPPVQVKKQVDVPIVNTPHNAPKTNEDPGSSAANCNYASLPPLNSRAPFSESLAKSALYERYSFLVNTGGLSSPLAVGLTFLDIKLLNSFVNTVTVVPGRGAMRKNDAAPVNATVYRFHAKYIVCKKYNNATVRTQYESDNVCFKANNGNWACGLDGPLETKELK